MNTVQGVEVLISDEKHYVCDQINKDKISKLGDVITRRVVASGLIIPHFNNLPLSAILEKVDDYFDIISQSIGGTTVKHSWVLIPTNLYFWEMDKIGISGHMLGSRVKNISGAKISYNNDTDTYSLLSSKLQKSSEAFLETNGWYIKDAARPHQFMIDDVVSRPVLVDIEPRIESHSYPPLGYDLL